MDRSQDILEVLTGRMARLESKEETPTNLPVKNKQGLRQDYDLLEFAINIAEEFKKDVKKTKGACTEFCRRLLIMYNHFQVAAEKKWTHFQTTTYF